MITRPQDASVILFPCVFLRVSLQKTFSPNLFSICSSHSVCAVTLRKEQTSSRSSERSQSHCCSYTTWSSTTRTHARTHTYTHRTYVCRGARRGKQTAETEISVSLRGKNEHDEEDVAPRPIGKQRSCFPTFLEMFSFTILPVVAVFVWPSMWFEENLRNRSSTVEVL